MCIQKNANTPPKTNGWIPKMMGLGKGDAGFKYGLFLVSIRQISGG